MRSCCTSWAYIHNGDVPKTYLRCSLWLAFLATTLAPSFLLFLASGNFSLVGCRVPGSQQCSLDRRTMLGLAVLRAREYYADVRASTWDQASQMDRVLAALPHLPAKAGAATSGSIRIPRNAVVKDPSRLLRLSFAMHSNRNCGLVRHRCRRGLLLPFWPSDAWAALVLFGQSTLAYLPSSLFSPSARSGSVSGAMPRLPLKAICRRRERMVGVAFVAGALPGVTMAPR